MHQVRILSGSVPFSLWCGEEDFRRACSASHPSRSTNHSQREKIMSDVLLQIDGKEVTAREGATILEAAQSVGISIPTLCHHQQLEPYGGCRVCSVEADARGRTTVVAACLY